MYLLTGGLLPPLSVSYYLYFEQQVRRSHAPQCYLPLTWSMHLTEVSVLVSRDQRTFTGNMRGRIIVIQTPSCVVLGIQIWLAMTQVCIPQRPKHSPISQRCSNPYKLSDRWWRGVTWSLRGTWWLVPWVSSSSTVCQPSGLVASLYYGIAFKSLWDANLAYYL